MASNKIFGLTKEFFKNPKQIGAIASSSKFLAEKLVKAAILENTKIIVELGAGTGIITDKILELMPKDAVLLSFEINNFLSRHIKEKIRDKRLMVINDDAANICKYLNEYGFQFADCVISGLPLAVFSKEERNQLLDVINGCLSEGGRYVQFQYSLSDMSALKNVFPKVNLDFEMRNIPPAFIYVCSNNINKGRNLD